jgi:hypothetical protein
MVMEAVECRSDTEYAERPLSLRWQGRRYEIAEIISQWQGPSEKGFCVKTIDGRAFELTYQQISDDWHVEPI